MRRPLNRSNKISITVEYKDQPGVRVSLPLNRNSVLFGLNGKGKTRTLRTISNIAKQVNSSMRDDTLIREVGNLNISTLEIGSVDYSEIFDGTSTISKRIDSRYKAYLKSVRGALLDLILLLDETTDQLELYNNYIARNLYRANKNLKDMFAYKEGDIMKFDGKESLPDRSLLEYTLRTIRIQTRRVYRGESDTLFEIDSSKLENILIIVEDISRGLRFSNYKILDSSNQAGDEIINLRRQLKEELSAGVHYISAENDELSRILEFISGKIKSINEEQSRKLWGNDAVISQEFDAKTDFLNKMKMVNKQLGFYDNISIDVNPRLFDLRLYKNKTEIDFSKASSGERHLLSLILNAAFRDEKILLIDEPEVSLSQNYHSRLVRSLMELAGNGRFLVFATHAPYIYRSCKEESFNLISFDGIDNG